VHQFPVKILLLAQFFCFTESSGHLGRYFRLDSVCQFLPAVPDQLVWFLWDRKFRLQRAELPPLRFLHLTGRERGGSSCPPPTFPPIQICSCSLSPCGGCNLSGRISLLRRPPPDRLRGLASPPSPPPWLLPVCALSLSMCG
jgi:hypothetical protein